MAKAKMTIKAVKAIINEVLGAEAAKEMLTKWDNQFIKDSIAEGYDTETAWRTAVESYKFTTAVDTEVAQMKEAQNAEVIEVVGQEVQKEEMTQTILFTASRGNNKKLTWRQVTVTPETEFVKVKGCAAPLPKEAAEIVSTGKFVAWIDQAVVEKFVEEGKPVRGMASTISDVFNRYCKVTETAGVNKVDQVLEIFTGIINDINLSTVEGGWEHAEDTAEVEDAE